MAAKPFILTIDCVRLFCYPKLKRIIEQNASDAANDELGITEDGE